MVRVPNEPSYSITGEIRKYRTGAAFSRNIAGIDNDIASADEFFSHL